MKASPSIRTPAPRESLAAALLLIASASAADFDEILVPVTVNTVPRGDHLVILDADRRVLIAAESFEALAIEGEPGTTRLRDRSWVALDSLGPGLDYELDPRDVSLRIDAPPERLAGHLLDFGRVNRPILPSGSPAAFLNYEARYSGAPGEMSSTPWILGETGVGMGGYLGLGTFARNAEDGRFVRLGTQVIRDDPGTLRRAVLGDLTAFSGPLGSRVLLGGVSVSKDFSLDPYSLKYPTPRLSGTATTPSEIEVYQNGILIGRERVAPGRFEIENLPGAANGLGEFDVRIRDAFGREEQLSSPFYFTTALLRRGTHEYSYAAGFTRQGVGFDSFDYRRPALLGIHSVGITDVVTAGIGAEATTGHGSLGPVATVLLGAAGELSIASSVSVSGPGPGFGGFVSHRFLSRWFSISSSLRSFSRDHVSLAYPDTRDVPAIEAGLTTSFDLAGLGAVTAGVLFSQTHGGRDLRRPFASYSRNLSRSANLFVTASSTSATAGDDEIDPLATGRPVHALFAGLQIYLGNDVSANLSQSVENRDDLGVVRLYKRPPGSQEGEGFGYEASLHRAAIRSEPSEAGGSGSLQYNGPFGLYRAEYGRWNDEDTATLAVSGGIIAMGGSLHASRPVSGSFALVSTSGLPGVDVTLDNRPVGTTDSNGEVLIPNLLAYHHNRIGIDTEKLPLDYAAADASRDVIPPYRGGSVVRFDVLKTQGFFGTILLERGRSRSRIALGRLELDDGREVPIGRDGEFYLENIPPGEYSARATAPDTRCGFRLRIPRTDQVLVDLGEVICAEAF